METSILVKKCSCGPRKCQLNLSDLHNCDMLADKTLETERNYCGIGDFLGVHSETFLMVQGSYCGITEGFCGNDYHALTT